MITGNLALTCIFSTQGEIGEPGQKGSKGDKGENVSSLHCGEGVSSLIHLPGHVTIVTLPGAHLCHGRCFTVNLSRNNFNMHLLVYLK